MREQDVSLYVYAEGSSPGSPNVMLMASKYPVDSFSASRLFYRTFDISQFTSGVKYYYWIKAIEHWRGKTTYSGTGWFNPSPLGGSYDRSASSVSGDISGTSRDISITSHHSAIAYSAPVSLTSTDYACKNIFSEV